MNDGKPLFDPEMDKWLGDNGLYIALGQCGFGRPCVGVMLMESCQWVDYSECRAAQTAKPEDAYHKGDYLCVLVQDYDYQKAVVQLASWLNAIVKAPHRVEDRLETGNISAFLRGPQPKKMLVDA